MAAISWIPLPDTKSHVNLEALDGGSFTGDYTFLHADVKSQPFRMYNFAFHVTHPGTGRHIMWDLGLTSVES